MARRIEADIKIWSFIEEELCRRGLIKEIKKVEFKDAVVDTGAIRLVLPKDIVEKLDLRVDGKVWVRYGDMRRAERDIVRGVCVEILGRVGTFDAVVEDRDSPLIGMEVLEGLDLWPDPIRGILTTNPESPDLPLFDLI